MSSDISISSIHQKSVNSDTFQEEQADFRKEPFSKLLLVMKEPSLESNLLIDKDIFGVWFKTETNSSPAKFRVS
ncbi:hypothetical protein BCV72DRAFT_334367 [Rhizopus microsporus var. microsporus]|uniref:Uncharacterized protein n=2 Tax=Rhizopus microsporus TaxID=58291 RepID=A0A2G4T7J1_RHIZD|nr:uncharacterized protein RHIMIDRAFT_287983 [Rhizopus microsporus ATCC 52813]ORE08529.1 hypothetical protein BCV72DRAFT_334367 [Rhizopus microsporus var. microsporus]PHZ16982.1 hypothetical protein RHIMIDRAFT_287983 [Rhizopus microsporus ATCC 52813]